MAGTFTITSNPPYLTARTLIYTAWQLRNFTDCDPPGPGVAGYEDFRVKQRGAGADLSVDVGNTTLNQAWIRGTTRDGMGLYRADNIDYTAPTANTFLAQINTGTIFTTGNATFPRIDQVFLRILDQQHDGGGSNLLQIQVVDGTATGGATLDNRTGVGAVPANSILLADVLMPALATTVTTANIRDRRQYPLSGSVPTLGATGSQIDQVAFVPCPGVPLGLMSLTPATFDSFQSAVLMYLPRRIVGATKMRWRYQQGATAATSNWVMAIFDASGRLIVAGSAVAFGGTVSQATQTNNTIAATTFEAGNYYVFFGVAPITAASSVMLTGALPGTLGPANATVAIPNAAYRLSAGGTTVPTTILSMTDAATVGAANGAIAVPIVSLSVT